MTTTLTVDDDVNGAELDLTYFDIHDNERVGLLVGGTANFRDSRGQFEHGSITNNLLGLAVTSAWMDLDRNFEDVSCYDNEVDIDSKTIAVPTFASPF